MHTTYINIHVHMLILVPTVYQCVYSICMYIHSFELYIDLSDVHVLFSFVQRHINDGTDTHMHHATTMPSLLAECDISGSQDFACIINHIIPWPNSEAFSLIM